MAWFWGPAIFGRDHGAVLLGRVDVAARYTLSPSSDTCTQSSKYMFSAKDHRNTWKQAEPFDLSRYGINPVVFSNIPRSRERAAV